MGKKKNIPYDADEEELDKQARSSRENTQLGIYLFVTVVIVSAWILGTYGFSFLWVFFLILTTFMVWWGKVMSLVEDHVRFKEAVVHRRRALRQSETAEWLNFVFNRWWVFSSMTIADLIKKALDPLLADIKPSFLESIELQSLTLGDQTPFFKYIHVYEYAEGVAGGKKDMSWTNVIQPPSGLPQAQQFQVVLEADVALQCDEFRMVFRARLGGKWMGMNLDLAIEKLNIAGKMQFIIHMDMDAPFPHISHVSLSFTEKPEVWFSIRMLKALQMMEIPILKSWIHHLVMDGLTQALVDPGKVDIRIRSKGPTNIASQARAKVNAQGVLTVTLCGEQTKGSVDPNEVNLFVFVEDTRYCQLRMGDQKQHTQHTQGVGSWQDTRSFLVDSLTTDKLGIKCKSKVLLSTYTLAQWDVSLADFPFEHKKCNEVSFEEKIPKRQGGGTVKLLLALEYTPLPSVTTEFDKANQPADPVTEVAGVMYVHVHSASGLMGLDRNGFSDPYCIIYSNGKKLKTTHYVYRTKNPKWEVSTEFIVGDFTKTMLSFIVYDWDGKNASEDDFLGSAYIVLTKDEPCVIRRSLTLGYNLLNGGQIDNNKMGTINISVIFRPVASVTRSEGSSAVNAVPEHHSSSKGTKGFISSARQRLASLRDKKSADSMGVGDLLALGHGILELRIIQAKDLVAMDSNGYSDPYCDVKVNGERKFSTSVKKKTLNPFWDEFVTLQLPKPNETLEILVWDRDPFFKKDFLGTLTFTLDDLKRYSGETGHDAGWFPLQRIQNGALQLWIKVIMEELTSGDHDSQSQISPVSTNSDSTTDSGLPQSLVNTSREDAPTSSRRRSSNQLTIPGDSIQECHDNGDSQSHEPLLLQDVSTFFTDKKGQSSPLGKSWNPDHTRPGVPEIVTPDEEDYTPPGSPTFSTESLPGKSHQARSRAGSHSRNRSSPLKIKRSLSDASLKRKQEKAAKETHLVAERPNVEVGRSPSPARNDTYYGIHGQVLNVKGLQGFSGSLYCKVKVDNRSEHQRERKSATAKDVAKSKSVSGWADAYFGLDFELDQGYGILKEAMVVFDIKTSHKSHFAWRGFTLQEILEGHHDATKWLPLENGVELEVTLHHRNLPLLSNKKPKSPAAFKRKTFKKIKEQ